MNPFIHGAIITCSSWITLISIYFIRSFSLKLMLSSQSMTNPPSTWIMHLRTALNANTLLWSELTLLRAIIKGLVLFLSYSSSINLSIFRLCACSCIMVVNSYLLTYLLILDISSCVSGFHYSISWCYKFLSIYCQFISSDFSFLVFHGIVLFYLIEHNLPWISSFLIFYGFYF